MHDRAYKLESVICMGVPLVGNMESHSYATQLNDTNEKSKISA